MGHALDNTIQDAIIRTKRMQGYSALWLPGTDHASIATEVRIIEAMSKEGLKKEDLGREAFLARAWEWKAQYGGRIVEQLKKLGSSLDWSRERFTMDEALARRYGSFQAPVRQRAHLPGQPYNKLVPQLPDRPFRRRGRI